MRTFTALAAVAFTAATLATASANMAPPSPMERAEDEVRNADAALIEAVAKKDVDAAVAFYAEDATVLPPDAPMLEGRDAIKAFWTDFTKVPGISLTTQIYKIRINQALDTAITTGTYSMKMGEGMDAASDEGKFAMTWVRTDDGWKAYTDMFSSNGPDTKEPAQSAPPKAD